MDGTVNKYLHKKFNLKRYAKDRAETIYYASLMNQQRFALTTNIYVL